MSVVHLRSGSRPFEVSVSPVATVRALREAVASARSELGPLPRLLLQGTPLSDSQLVASVITEGAVVDAAPASPLVQRYAGDLDRDPEFARDLAALAELGFSRSEADGALRAAFGNADRAAQFLMAGEWPAVGEDDALRAFEEIRRLLVRRPRALESVVRTFEALQPDGLGRRYREHPEEIAEWLLLDPKTLDLQGVRSGSPWAAGSVDAAAVRRFVALGFPGEQAEKVLSAAGGDEELAESLLYAI
jgi:hypothetical protein